MGKMYACRALIAVERELANPRSYWGRNMRDIFSIVTKCAYYAERRYIFPTVIPFNPSLGKTGRYNTAGERPRQCNRVESRFICFEDGPIITLVYRGVNHNLYHLTAIFSVTVCSDYELHIFGIIGGKEYVIIVNLADLYSTEKITQLHPITTRMDGRPFPPNYISEYRDWRRNATHRWYKPFTVRSYPKPPSNTPKDLIPIPPGQNPYLCDGFWYNFTGGIWSRDRLGAKEYLVGDPNEWEAL